MPKKIFMNLNNNSYSSFLKSIHTQQAGNAGTIISRNKLNTLRTNMVSRLSGAVSCGSCGK